MHYSNIIILHTFTVLNKYLIFLFILHTFYFFYLVYYLYYYFIILIWDYCSWTENI